MKTNILRAKRTFDETGSAPEYAMNELAIEILFPEFLMDIRDVSVRIYSMSYELMGVASFQKQPGKRMRKVRLSVSSSSYWEAETYRVYVYVDSHPVWFVCVCLDDSYEVWSDAILERLSDSPKEMFFAEKLCFTNWWQKLAPGKYREALIDYLLESLCMYSDMMEKGIWKSCPNMLVVGDALKSKALSSFVLAGFVCDDDIIARYNFSLVDFVSNVHDWDKVISEMKEKKAVVVEVPKLKYDNRSISFLKMFVFMILHNAFQGCTFIFNGTEENIRLMKEKCPHFSELFNVNTTFHVYGGNGDDEDEFDALLYDFIHNPDPDTESVDPEYHECDIVHGESDCDEVLRQLNQLVGLRRLKEELRDASIMSSFLKRRRDMCLEIEGDSRCHMLFLGNPGTGKTTVAKLVGRIYHAMGLLSKGHVVETCRTNLIGEYIGQTENRMKEVIDSARGGVLFIDEAYTLVESDNDSKDYGREVINSLLTVLSEPNPDMIVILAGYDDKMQKLLRLNPGLKDRFPLCFHFDDYTADELYEIALRTLQRRNFVLTAGAEKKLRCVIGEAVLQRDEFFGNGRWVSNLIEHGIVKSMAARVMSSVYGSGDKAVYSIIEESDIEDAENNFLRPRMMKLTLRQRIGFTA